jgi:hypothetical protein
MRFLCEVILVLLMMSAFLVLHLTGILDLLWLGYLYVHIIKQVFLVYYFYLLR